MVRMVKRSGRSAGIVELVPVDRHRHRGARRRARGLYGATRVLLIAFWV